MVNSSREQLMTRFPHFHKDSQTTMHAEI